METKANTIPTSDRIAYVTARVGFTLIISLYSGSYLSLFLNVICGLPMPTIASVLAIAKLIDLAEVLMFQPVLFSWAAKGKWGRYRTWFVVSPIGCLFGHVLLQTALTAAVPNSVKIPFVIIGYVTVNATLNIQSTAMNSMNAIWIKDPVDRFRTQTQGNLMNNLASTLFGFAMLPIMYAIGGVESINAKGMTFLVILYNVFNIIACIPVFRFTKRLDLDSGAGGGKTNVFSAIKLLFTNRNAAGLFMSAALANSGQSSWAQAFAFIFLYYYKRPDVLSVYNGFQRGIMMLANMLTLAIVKRLKPKVAFTASLIMPCINYLFVYFFANDAVTAVVFVCIAYMFTGVYQSTLTPLYGDIVDYTRWKTGESIIANIFTIQQATPKASSYIGNFMVTAIAAIGFAANNPETHTPEILARLKALACFIPAGLYACGLLTFFTVFNIPAKVMEQARAELAERDKAAQTS
ncbi:MAG: MFS transporter [Eubacteriaceae bacterium]|nr:MFS transporter [Eubacteriaceae bacterium]